MSLGARLLEGIPKRPVVLHLDLNRTIIEVDLAGGKTLKDILNNNLATCVAGTLVDGGKQWKPIADPDGKRLPSFTEDEVKALKEKEDKTKGVIYTYDEYVDEIVAPRPAGMDKLSKDEALALWGTVTKKRRALKNTFSEPGQPGEMFHEPFYTDMFQKMQKPKEEGGGGGEHFVIPAFFTLIQTLWQQQWPCRVVFRTFGRELALVLDDVEQNLKQINPGMWGLVSKNAMENVNKALAAPTTPARSPAAVSSAAFVSATSTAANNKKDNNRHGAKPWCPVSALYRDDKVGTVISHGVDFSPKDLDEWKKFGHSYAAVELNDLYEEFTSASSGQLLGEHAAGGGAGGGGGDDLKFPAIQFRGFIDHYPWWAANGEHEKAGKVYPVRVSPFTTEQDPLQVFFDDNIYFADPEGHSIIDIRNVTTHDHIFDAELQKAFMVRVEPREAILDEYFFVRKFAECAAAQLKVRQQKS